MSTDNRTQEEVQQTPKAFPALLKRIVECIQTAPEGVRIGFGVAAGVLIPAGLVFVIVYRNAILQAILFLLVIAIGSTILAAFLVLLRQKRHAQEELVKADNEASLQAERRRMTERAHELKLIADGRVEPITDTGPLIVRNSEVVWFRCQASTGEYEDEEFGDLFVTSMRVVFVGEVGSAEIPLSHINAVTSDTGLLQLKGKSVAYSRSFVVADPECAEAHIRRAVQVYHRQVDVGFEEARRKIPQEVKTAVWQRDGGRCIECGATDYLEFDHVIPFSRGGANTTANLQLLCRRCNLKKRDSI